MFRFNSLVRKGTRVCLAAAFLAVSSPAAIADPPNPGGGANNPVWKIDYPSIGAHLHNGGSHQADGTGEPSKSGILELMHDPAGAKTILGSTAVNVDSDGDWSEGVPGLPNTRTGLCQLTLYHGGELQHAFSVDLVD